MKQLVKQAWAQLRQQPIISAVSVAGTALAIFLIMLVVMMQQVKTAPFAPESNRNRFLHVKMASITNTAWGANSSSNGPWSVHSLQEIYKPMQTPEAVTVYTCMPTVMPVSIAGQPSLAVVTESVARRLFGTTDVVGKELLLAYVAYRIVGVVKDVSVLASTAYAQMWVPYTSTGQIQNTWEHGMMGGMSCTILAKDPAGFPAIREEALRRLEAKNSSLEDTGYSFINRNRPYTQEKDVLAFGANYEPDMEADRRQRWMIYLIQPSTFLMALVFCFVLNLLSTGIPAWRASRMKIVDSIGGKLH